MSVAPEHVAPSVTLGIGGVRIRFEAAEADLRIRVTFPRTRFVDASDRDADCVVRVRLGEPKLEAPPTFVSGGPWELYEGESGGDRLAIFTGLASGGREPVMRVDLTPALDRADLTAHPRYAPGRTFVVGYPLDEYLMARLLARRGAVIMHASTVSAEGRDGIGAYVFAGHSGAGKSTMASIAEQSGFRVLSDDRTVLSVDNDLVFAAGTPWHGNHGSGSPDAAPVEAIFLLEQAEANSVTRMDSGRAFSELMVRSVRPMAQRAEHVAVVNVLERVVRAVPCAGLRFAPSAAALDAVHYFVRKEPMRDSIMPNPTAPDLFDR